jgi:hypothetical protein
MAFRDSFEEPSGGGGHILQDEGVDLPARARMNFTGTGVTASDDSVNGQTDVVIPGDYAPASHVGSRDGHPLATTTLDGIMAGADKAKLDSLVSATPNPAFAVAQISADVTLLAGNTIIPFDTGVSNAQGIFVATQNGMVIKRAGRYLVPATLSFRAIAVNIRVFTQLTVNGIVTGRLSDDDIYLSNSNPGPSGFRIETLAVNDLVKVRCFVGSDATIAATSSTQFTIMEL